jgi:hypothetical protein
MKYLFIFLSILSSFANEIIPGDRLIQWDPGVRGGIPSITNEFVRISPSTNNWVITQAALDACPSNYFVLFLNGVHQFTNDLKVRKDGIVLKGENPTNTIFYFTNILATSSFTLSNYCIIFDKGFNYAWDTYTASPLNLPLKGSAFVTSTVPHNLTANLIVYIDQRTNWIATNDFVASGTNLFPISNLGNGNQFATWVGRENGGRPMGQISLVEEVISPTVVKINPPLYHSYIYNPEMIRIDTWVTRSALENFTLSNNVFNAETSNSRDNVLLQGTYNCWFKDLYFIGCKRRDFWCYATFWNTWTGIRLNGGIPTGTDSIMNGTQNGTQYASDRAYPIFFGPHVTASLVTDSIIERKTMGIAWEGCASGNVIGYNFFTNIWWVNQAGDSDRQRRFSLLMHGPHPTYNLFEGNWCADKIRADEVWGTSSLNLCAYNSVHQQDRGAPASQTWTIDIERNNDYWSFVGNEIGGGNILEDNYEYINGETAIYVDPKSTIWKIGYRTLGNGITNYSFNTINTIIRYGNWCYRTNDVISGSGITYHLENVSDARYGVNPRSFYLKSAPTNFGILSLGWPRLGAHNPGASFTNIPAGYRFAFGTNPPGVTNVGYSKSSGVIKIQGVSKIQ